MTFAFYRVVAVADFGAVTTLYLAGLRFDAHYHTKIWFLSLEKKLQIFNLIILKWSKELDSLEPPLNFPLSRSVNKPILMSLKLVPQSTVITVIVWLYRDTDLRR